MLGFTRRICTILKQECISVRSRHSKTQIAPLQKSALEERCILVDENDKQVGEATKEHCHLIAKDGSIPLHRAFSVFLFNDKGELLIQKRSSNKVHIIVLCLFNFQFKEHDIQLIEFRIL